MDLRSGERVIMDSGRFPVSYEGEGTVINGRLYLTDRRIVFEPSRFQSIIGSAFLSVKGRDAGRVEIPLEDIVKVEKGFMAHVKIITEDGTYSFKGMRKADKWVEAIEESARLLAGESNEDGQVRGEEATSTGYHYCPFCGARVEPGDIYCGNCGRKLPKT